jgi:hypothetical protein
MAAASPVDNQIFKKSILNPSPYHVQEGSTFIYAETEAG